LEFVLKNGLEKPKKFGRKKLGAANTYVCEFCVPVCLCALCVCVVLVRKQKVSGSKIEKLSY